MRHELSGYSSNATQLITPLLMCTELCKRDLLFGSLIQRKENSAAFNMILSFIRDERSIKIMR